MDYIIDVHSVFEIEGQTDDVAISCPCQYDHTAELSTVLYDDYAEDGKCVNTSITFGEGVDINRSGGIIMGLHLREGVTISDKYTTDFGVIIVDYTAEKLCHHFDEQGGTALLRYTIDLGGVVSKNTITITVKRTDVGSLL